MHTNVNICRSFGNQPIVCEFYSHVALHILVLCQASLIHDNTLIYSGMIDPRLYIPREFLFLIYF